MRPRGGHGTPGDAAQQAPCPGSHGTAGRLQGYSGAPCSGNGQTAKGPLPQPGLPHRARAHIPTGAAAGWHTCSPGPRERVSVYPPSRPGHVRAMAGIPGLPSGSCSSTHWPGSERNTMLLGLPRKIPGHCPPSNASWAPRGALMRPTRFLTLETTVGRQTKQAERGHLHKDRQRRGDDSWLGGTWKASRRRRHARVMGRSEREAGRASRSKKTSSSRR